MKSKKIIIAVLISLLVIGLIGITFAAYTYTRNGAVNSKQLVGDIYMHYTEFNSLTLENAMPRSSYIANKYFEFTIDGKNTTTNKDIYYDILLSHGDLPQGKTEENRIQDKFLKFRLVEIINSEETEIFTNKSYNDLTNKRIHVEIIPKNTTTEVVHTYRLYMWIGSEVIIGNTENLNKDYDQSEWNNLFASIKVGATGDFTEKSMTTPASCFTTELTFSNGTLNQNMTSGELQACIDYVNGLQWNEGETSEAFCNGSGTNAGYTFQEILDNNWFGAEKLTYFQEHNIIIVDEGVRITGYDSACGSEIIIPDELPSTSYTLNTNMTSEELQVCVNYLTDQWGPEEEGNTVDVGETYQAFCNGTGTKWGETFQGTLNDDGWWDDYRLEYFKEHNIIIAEQSTTKYSVVSLNLESFQNIHITKITIPNSTYVYYDGEIQDDCDAFDAGTIIEKGNITKVCGVVSDSCFTTTIDNNEVLITGYDVSCGVNVMIPSTINGISVTEIGNRAFSCNGELCNGNLKSIVIPSSVTTIGPSAFQGNILTSIEIPNSVTTIGIYAFSQNQLTSVEIPNSVTTIEQCAFSENQLTSVEIPNSVTTIGNHAFFRNQLTSITIPNSVTTIGPSAFRNNQLTSVEIPNSVTTIEYYAFNNNYLTSVTIGNGITSIGAGAFNKSDTSNPDLQSIRIDKTCSYVKQMTSYPWLSSSSPYTASGVTIYGAGNTVCDTF